MSARRRVEGLLDRIARVDRCGMIAPEPTHHVRQDRAAHFLAVAIHSPCVVHVITFLRQGLHQPDVLEEPVTLLVVVPVGIQGSIVVTAVLQENADGLLFGGTHQLGIYVAAPQIYETADDAQHFLKLGRAFPGDSECGDGSGTGSADAVTGRVLRDVVVLVEHGQQFIHDDSGVTVVERVVLLRPIGVAIAPILRSGLGLIGTAAGVDEDADHDWQFATPYQIVHDVLRSQVARGVHEGLAVLEDHEAGHGARIVLRRDVDPVGVLGPWVCRAGERKWPAYLPFGNALLFQRVGSQFIEGIGIWRGRSLGPQCRDGNKSNDVPHLRAKITHMRMLGAFGVFALGLSAQPAFDPDKALATFLTRMQDTLERQPDYTCLETIERTRRSRGGATQVQDILRLEVALVGSKEMFAWPGSKEFEDTELTDLVTSGMFGNGNFALYPRMLFGGGGPPFVYAGDAEISGRQMAQYNFRVVQAMSGYQLSVNRQRVTVGFHGSFYIDKETSNLRRIILVPDNIPPEFQMTATEDRVDYDRVLIGDERFLMPVESDLMMAFPDVVSRNHVRFTGCRKFTGESTLLFLEKDPEESEGPVVPAIREVTLPLDAEMKLTLTSDLVLESGAGGDIVEAKLGSDIKVGKEIVAPKGAIARGRVMKLERQTDFYVVALRFTDLEWKGGHATLNLRFDGLGGRTERGSYSGVAPDQFLIARGGAKRLKDLQTYWHVAR